MEMQLLAEIDKFEDGVREMSRVLYKDGVQYRTDNISVHKLGGDVIQVSITSNGETKTVMYVTELRFSEELDEHGVPLYDYKDVKAQINGITVDLKIYKKNHLTPDTNYKLIERIVIGINTIKTLYTYGIDGLLSTVSRYKNDELVEEYTYTTP